MFFFSHKFFGFASGAYSCRPFIRPEASLRIPPENPSRDSIQKFSRKSLGTFKSYFIISKVCVQIHSRILPRFLKKRYLQGFVQKLFPKFIRIFLWNSPINIYRRLFLHSGKSFIIYRYIFQWFARDFLQTFLGIPPEIQKVFQIYIYAGIPNETFFSEIFPLIPK